MKKLMFLSILLLIIVGVNSLALASTHDNIFKIVKIGQTFNTIKGNLENYDITIEDSNQKLGYIYGEANINNVTYLFDLAFENNKLIKVKLNTANYSNKLNMEPINELYDLIKQVYDTSSTVKTRSFNTDHKNYKVLYERQLDNQYINMGSLKKGNIYGHYLIIADTQYVFNRFLMNEIN